ncbi:hypothetical protein AGLY_009437 [Aphis glycines]|uniref:Uncharacterized protein n=1 Tax=Aphis glycines TaxID=307491 RepID=A0A6G0THF3_APHGL|nr:hypothetical protein AGLY_009437 [Aphis glycines]
MSTVTALFHPGGTLLCFQCRYVSPSSPGAGFSNFPRRFDTSAHWNGPIGTGSLPSIRWNILVSHVDGAHVLVKCSSTSGTATSQDCPSPDTITLTARRLLRLYRDWISLASFGSIAVPLPELRPSRLTGSLAMTAASAVISSTSSTNLDPPAFEHGSLLKAAKRSWKACRGVVSSGCRIIASSTRTSGPSKVSGKGISTTSSLPSATPGRNYY